MAAWRSIAIRVAPAVAGLLALLLASAGMLGTAEIGRASLEKPSYAAGDRWVYVFQGSLDGLPGLNASEGGGFQLGLNGVVQVDIVGAAPDNPGGVIAETQASGFLNGTFAIPNLATVRVSGTFSSDAKEVWEGADYLPVAANTSTRYVIDVSAGIAASVTTDLWLNATTSYGPLPPFNLSVGDSASAPFTSDVRAATSFSAFGFANRIENSTRLTGTWSRQVLGVGNVSVDAGVFSAYRLNQSLSGFPGLAIAGPAFGSNETAWFSNDVGYYVKRTAYVNGTPVAEMELKSHTGPTGLPLVDLVLIIALPIAAVALLVFVLLRRRKARAAGAKGSSGVGPVGELPPKEPGGKA